MISFLALLLVHLPRRTLKTMLQDVDRGRQLAAAIVLAMKTRIPTLVLGAVNANIKPLLHLLWKRKISIICRRIKQKNQLNNRQNNGPKCKEKLNLHDYAICIEDIAVWNAWRDWSIKKDFRPFIDTSSWSIKIIYKVYTGPRVRLYNLQRGQHFFIVLVLIIFYKPECKYSFEA